MEQICGGVKQKLVFKAQNKSTCYDICIPVARAQHDIKMVFPSKETLAIFARKTHLRGKSNSHWQENVGEVNISFVSNLVLLFLFRLKIVLVTLHTLVLLLFDVEN